MLHSSSGKGSGAIKPELWFMIKNHQQEHGAQKKKNIINQTKETPILSEKFPFAVGNEAQNRDLGTCFISVHGFIQAHTAALPGKPN